MLDPTVVQIIKDLDEATNGVASRIETLISDAQAAGSLTAAELVAALQPEVNRLRGLAANPSEPVPQETV